MATPKNLRPIRSPNIEKNSNAIAKDAHHDNYNPLSKLPPTKDTTKTAPRQSTCQQIQYSAGYSRSIAHLAALSNTALINFIDLNPPISTAYNTGKIWDDQLKKFASWSQLVKHPDSKIAKQWKILRINEFTRLFQGYGDTEGIDVLKWIFKHNVPHSQRVTYLQYTVDIQPEKDKPYQTHITVGGHILEYFGNTTMHCASIETVKLDLNSVLSTANS